MVYDRESTVNDVSLVDEFRKILETRRREDPLVVAMSQEVKQIRTEVRGLAQSGNLALGNSREAVDQMQEAFIRIAALEADLAAALERIKNSASWAAKIDDWAKGMGMT